MASVSVKISANFDDLVKSVASRKLDQLAQDITDDAKRLCPVNTGRLRDSIHVETVDDGTREIVAGSDEIDYASYVEFGTTRMRAQPYLRPAALKKRRKY